MAVKILPVEISIWIAFLSVFLLVLMLLSYLINKKIKPHNESLKELIFVFSVFATVLLFLRFGFGMVSIQGLILFILLLFASCSDLLCRKVTDSIPIMIVLTALIGIEITSIPMMAFGAVCITIPQLIIAVIRPNSYGGADIKIMAACSFLLGLERALLAIIVGLSLAIIVTIIIRRIQKKNLKVAFPVVPYLALGCFISFLI